MGMPFQCLSPLGKGTLFCAAKGYEIQTFDLGANPQLLFSWRHPSVKQVENSKEAVGDEEPTRQQSPSKRRKLSDAGSNAGAEDEPTKRRKLDSEAGSNAGAEEGQEETPAREGKKNQKKAKTKGQPHKAEPPFIVLLTATEDGSHVIAVTGQDKTLWVFEHDGKGLLKEISRR